MWRTAVCAVALGALGLLDGCSKSPPSPTFEYERPVSSTWSGTTTSTVAPARRAPPAPSSGGGWKQGGGGW